MNICIFSGHIGQDLVLKKTKEGKSVLNFSIGVRRNKEITDWVNCSVFEEKADFVAKYFQKGSFIEIRGAYRTSEYEKDGKKVYSHNFEVKEVDFGGKPKEKENVYGEDSLLDEHEPTPPPFNPFADLGF